MRHWKKLGLGFVGAMAVSGCLTDDFPHNDVLVFGTKTNLGIDIAAPGASATMPKFTIGYDRQEAVWMPLTLNGRKLSKEEGQNSSHSTEEAQRILKTLNTCHTEMTKYSAIFHTEKDKAVEYCRSLFAPSILYVGKASGIDSTKGGSTTELDTYSVFASFGARGSYSLNGSEGGLAQFFATGIAAQRLGANPQVGSALNAGGPKAAAEQAKAEQAKADAEIAKIDPEKYLAEKYKLTESEVHSALITAKEAGDAADNSEGWLSECYNNTDARDRLSKSEDSQISMWAGQETLSRFLSRVRSDPSGEKLPKMKTLCEEEK